MSSSPTDAEVYGAAVPPAAVLRPDRTPARLGFLRAASRVVAVAAAAAVAAAIAVSGCALIDLRELSIATYPEANGAILSSINTPLRVSFDSGVDRKEAEAAFSVSSAFGAAEGDIEWKGNGFSFVPVAGWLPGVRYRMTLKGSIRALDGREARPNRDLFFFAVHSGAAPYLASFSPPDGASVGVSEESGACLLLSFSRAMDTRKTETALNVQPSAEFAFSWNEDATVLRLVPKKPLSPCATYRWKLSADAADGAASSDGAPLAREASASFATDADSSPPSVSRTFAALQSGSSWIDSGGSLSDLDAGQAVGIVFSEPMDADTLLSALSFSPSLPGRADVIGTNTAVFIPDRIPEPESEITLIVSPEASDLSGLGMAEEYRERFVPAVPYLRMLSAETGTLEPVDPVDDSSSAVTIALPDGVLSLTLRFSVSFDTAARISATERIGLSPFFPAVLSSPTLKSVSWIASDTVCLTWEGLERSPSDRTNWYRLSLPGGRGGIACAEGLFMKEDLSIYLEANK